MLTNEVYVDPWGVKHERWPLVCIMCGRLISMSEEPRHVESHGDTCSRRCNAMLISELKAQGMI